MRRHVAFGAALALCLNLAGLPRSVVAGPITFNTALPVHTGEWIVRQQTIWLRATDDPSPLDRDLSVLVAPVVVVYGLNSRVALFAIQPFLSRQIEVTTPSGRLTRAATGLGDLTAIARVTAVAFDRLGETIRFAPFAGFKRGYVAPGLQWVTLRTVLEAAVQIPVVQNTNGLGLRENFTALLSVRVSF